MDKDRLRSLLRSIHSSSGDVADVDLEDRQLLMQLHDDIETLLEMSSEVPAAHREEVRTGMAGASDAAGARRPRASMPGSATAGVCSMSRGCQRAGSVGTAVALLIWERHGVAQSARLDRETATAVRYFVPLEQLAQRLPVLNGNWFFNRSPAFGWHASHEELVHLFGDQLAGYHWVPSFQVKQLKRINASFNGNVRNFVSSRLAERIANHYNEDMVRLGYGRAQDLAAAR